jgi:outer membrane protein OmpA-like peptidoglycan-associated protein
MAKNSTLIFDGNANLFLIDHSTVAGKIIFNVDTKNQTSNKVNVLADLASEQYATLTIDGAALDMSALADAYARGYKTSMEIIIATVTFTETSGTIIGNFAQNSGEVVGIGRLWKWKIIYDETNVGGSNANNFSSLAVEDSKIITGLKLSLESQAIPLNFPDLTYNQDQTQKLLYDTLPSDAPQIVEMWSAAEETARYDRGNFPLFLEQLSGSFLATLLTLPALDINPNSFFENVENTTRKIWMTVDGGFFQTDKKNVMGAFEAEGGRAVVGADIIKTQKIRAGVFANAGSQNVKQGKINKADVKTFGGGLYGGAFGLFGNLLNVKLNLGYELNNINAERKVDIVLAETLQSNFNVQALKVLSELEFTPGLNFLGVDIDFFARANFANVSNDKIEESYENGSNAALIVDADFYRRLETDIGINFSKSLSKLELGAKVYVGFLALGAEKKYTMHFLARSAEFSKIEAAPYSNSVIGFNLAASYPIFQNVDLTANAASSLGLAKDQMQIAGGLGVKWYFQGRTESAQPQPQKPEAENLAPAAPPVAPPEPIEAPAVEIEPPVEVENVERQAPPQPSNEIVPFLDPDAEGQDMELFDGAPAEPYVRQETGGGERYIPPMAVRVLDVDKEQEALRNSSGDVYTVTLASFDFNSWQLSAADRAVIVMEAKRLARRPHRRLILIGYADDIGTDEINIEVSWRRADAVYRELVNNGVDPFKIEYWGLGSKDPIAPNDSEANRAKNRRVTLTVQ